MDNNYRGTNIDNIEYATVVGQNKLLRASFSWMALAMVITTLTSLLFAFVPNFTSVLYNVDIEGYMRPTTLAYVIMFAPLAFILALNFGFNRMSFPVLIAVFVSFAAIMGISLSSIFFVYTVGSIVKVFFSTTALFALMAIAGYTTKTDLTKLGSILMIGFFGILIASLINMFMRSPGMDYVISIIGVIVFTGLTAYDVQKIKQLGEDAGSSTHTSKLGVMGALTLYMDFINLFMFLLRLFGRRD
ncbi:MAG: Bax inhibitor/YccA family protein [Bacteroidetes bacterium]|jgi:FtsH-binding integral membrane protein|nr:Bax inhibitor/YccA family protein [Bacteroidota bacterium]